MFSHLNHTAGSFVNQCIVENSVNMKQCTRALSALGLVVAVTALSACGGGGDGAARTASNGTVDPYVGTFQSGCVQEGSANSYRIRLTVVKTSASTVDATAQYVSYAGTSCAGNGTAVAGNSGTDTLTLTGTKSASGKTVDKFSTSSGEKDIAYTDGTSLYFGE
ncbi:MAG: hypothetical protein RLZZ182_191, partial [Pseudomonadota bacterium]